ncbi:MULTISPECIES: hypothetical protein [Photobacterium]|uniref:Uncharacterized protein n=2 Tax=Photobacterium TaxID=657 RepID=Q6LK68_PHOPR|nr:MULTISPECIES: hypothetical protein [Photobacterium]PSU44941.1 hypothetical protein C9J12_25045 [Photobacterium frigidiphilum]CAG22312.1 hypothetical protein PBPRB0439 [Photobacterium profundum SS9]
MKKTSKWFFASVIGGAAFWASASINHETIDDFGLLTMSETEMSSIRGGFVSINDTLINIGLSISTALNGEKVFTSYIADLTIDNGVLTSSSSSSVKPVSVVQNGEGNTAPEMISIDTGSIASIIQNTNDNTTIRVETQLDIQADVNSFIERQVIYNRIENSILYSSY